MGRCRRDAEAFPNPPLFLRSQLHVVHPGLLVESVQHPLHVGPVPNRLSGPAPRKVVGLRGNDEIRMRVQQAAEQRSTRARHAHDEDRVPRNA